VDVLAKCCAGATVKTHRAEYGSAHSDLGSLLSAHWSLGTGNEGCADEDSDWKRLNLTLKNPSLNNNGSPSERRNHSDTLGKTVCRQRHDGLGILGLRK
jgi:hypothetical protein